MKKIICFVLAGLLSLSIAACGQQPSAPDAGKADESSAAQSEQTEQAEKPDGSEKVEITLWTYPVGSWGNAAAVSNLINDFTRQYPNYEVSVECLDYTTGDERISEAEEKGELPDLVLEGPERLVANWGDKGKMADLSDLWESEKAGQIYGQVKDACRHRNGAYYEYPLCMTAHCMVINYDMFKAADALKYIDEGSHTWTTDDFARAVKALRDYGQEDVGIVYCGGQGGDQGTRALVNNLYGGRFANPEHTGYVFESEENIRALELLNSLDGIRFDSGSQGTEEISMFCEGKLAMAFCWNVSQEINQTVSNPDLDLEFFPMMFPTSDGSPTLQGGIWGLGIFDNGDAAKIEASKQFIRFLAEDDSEYAKAVLTSTYWPVRDIPDLYANDELMQEYGIFTQFVGDYYQVTPGWTDVRTAWWTMLQNIGKGKDVREEVKAFNETANNAAKASMKEE